MKGEPENSMILTDLKNQLTQNEELEFYDKSQENQNREIQNLKDNKQVVQRTTKPQDRNAAQKQ